MASKVKRRLTTILCADALGYSGLMERDEVGTLDTLRLHRGAMTALITRHDGRMINTWGDAIIAEFASVVEAVQCAIEIQQELAAGNQALPDTRRMWFRIGINLGDVMVDDDDLYGEGVNIAARLQELAEPGGIMISRPVYDQVRNKLSIGFDYLGERSVKNVALPVPSYRVRTGPPPEGEALSPDPAPTPVPETHQAFPRVRSWLQQIPRPIRVFWCVVAFLLVINLMSSPGTLWVKWPAAIALLLTLLHLALRRDRRPQ